MKNLISDLHQLMEERFQQELCFTPAYQKCQQRREDLLAQIRQTMGKELSDRLDDVLWEYTQLYLESSFTWGLWLGLALDRL